MAREQVARALQHGPTIDIAFGRHSSKVSDPPGTLCVPRSSPCRRRLFLRFKFMAIRDDYLQSALKVIDDPNILVNVISRRVKQLRRGSRPLVESLEKLSPEDTALREVAEGKISYVLATEEEIARRD